jgi:hypothetical protein
MNLTEYFLLPDLLTGIKLQYLKLQKSTTIKAWINNQVIYL